MNELELKIKEFLKNKDDQHIDSIIEDMVCDKIIDDYEDIGGDWSSEGKYDYGDLTYKLVCNGINYYANFSQMRSGSYYTDYYYQTPDLDWVVTEDEYNTPDVKITVSFKNKNIDIREDKSVVIDKQVFQTFEEAMNSIIGE